MNPDGAGAEASGEGVRGSCAAVLGCGAVGSAIAAELARSQGELLLWSRTRERAEALAASFDRREGVHVSHAAVEAIERAKIVLLCVTDAVLASFAEDQATKAPQSTADERLVVHTNGFHGLEVLDPWRAVGWQTGKLHPLTSLPPGGGGAVRGAWFATASTPGGRPLLAGLLASLGGRELALDEGEESSRTLHAAASLLSGGLVALFELTSAVARTASADGEGVESAFLSLLASTASNLQSQGSRDALTGPAARGAAEIVRAHLETLAGKDADAAELYRRLGARMIALAAARGSIDERSQAELERIFRRG